MKKPTKVSVVHLWSDYYINADGNPHYYLKKQGCESSIVAAKILTDNANLPDDIYSYSIKLLSSSGSNSIITRIKNRLMRGFFWKNVNKWAIKKVETIKPTILHAHFGHTAVQMLPTIVKSNLPVVVSFYGVDGSSLIIDPQWIPRFKETFKHVSTIIVLTEVVKERIKQLGFDERKIIVWNIPFKLDVYAFRKKERGNVIKFITCARFVEKKGYPFLVAAFKKVHSQNLDTTLTIMGYGPEKVKIQNDVNKHGLQDSVTIIDTKLRTDYHEFYYKQLCEHDIFVLPSTTAKNGDDEAGPALTLVAAQAAGLPVICTPFVGSDTTVIDKVTGIFCEQDNADSIAQRMLYLIDQPELCDEIGKNASEYVNPLYSEDAQLQKVLDIYIDNLK